MSKTTNQAKKHNRLSLLALEPRLVFDGALGVTDPTLIERTGLDLNAIAAAAAESLAKTAAVAAPAVREGLASRREIVFVDDALSDLPTLLAGIGSSAQRVQIQHGQDGLRQINAALAGQEAFDAIHIIAHGRDGVQTLGTTVFDTAHLDALSAGLGTLGSSLTQGGDLLLYGCNVAQSAKGQAFLEKLVRITGADVAASSDRTGASGNWTLEHRAGAIEAQTLQAQEWQGDLAASNTLDGPPQSCWNLEPTDISQGLKLAFNEYVDPASIDLDPATAGQQRSLDVLDSNNVKLGSYEASADGILSFLPTAAFRGTGVTAIDIKVDVKAYKLDSNNQIVKDVAGKPVPDDTVAPRTEQHKVALGDSSTTYVPTGATYSGQVHVLFGSYMDGTAWSREAMYLTRAIIDSWIDPADQTDPKFGINKNVLREAPAPIKFYDPATGLDRSAATLQQIKDAFLPAYQAIEPSLDSVAWIAGNINGKPAWDLIWYNSTAPLKPLTNWTSTTDAAASVGRGFWLVSQPESTLSDPKTSGASMRGDFWGQRVPTLTNVPVLRAVHTFGVPLTEVCGVNNVTVNEGSPYAIFEVGGFEGNSISALQLSGGTGTLGVDTGSTLQYFNGIDWVNYVPGQPITIPSDGDNQPYEVTQLLVRVAITNDAPLETVNGVGDTLTLTASYAFTTGPGPEKTGTLTILDNGEGQVFGQANTTGTPDNPTTSTDPTVQRFLDDDFRPTAPETCWAVASVNIAERVKLGALEAIDFASVDLDVFTAGRQTSRTVQIDGVDVGTYSVNNQGQVVFSGTTDFRGQAPEVFYSVDVVNKNNSAFIRKEVAGFQVGDDGVETLYEMKPANVVFSRLTLAMIEQSIADDAVYLSGAEEYPSEKASPSTVGKFFKVWDASTGFTLTDQMASEISAAYLPAIKTIYPMVDTLSVTVEMNEEGEDELVMVAYNSLNLLDPQIYPLEKEVYLRYSPGLFPGDYYEPLLAEPDQTGRDYEVRTVYAANVPIQGLPVTEVCGVSSVVVNEGSPWAVFEVGGFETGTISKLELSSVSGTAGVDAGAAIEFFNGSAWVPYTGEPVTVPDDGDRTYIEPTKLLVRVAIQPDAASEVREELKLTATYAFGPVKTGTLTILDDGTGSVFGSANTTATPDVLGTSTDPSLPTRLDDDRPLSVSNDWVYESAGFASFTVSGAPGQPVTLALADGTASASAGDYTNALQLWNGSAWVAYAPGTVLGSDGTLKVRVAVNTDASTESPESFQLVATNLSGISAIGTGTIIDGANPVPYAPLTDNVSQCYLPVTINLLANDFAVKGPIDATSVLLSATPNGAGATSLTTVYGTYVANANGSVTFTPVATLPDGSYFNGVASVVYYTVKDAAGQRLAPTAIHMGDGTFSDPSTNLGSTPLTISTRAFDGTKTQVQQGMWSVGGATLQNRVAGTSGATNLMVNGDFTPTEKLEDWVTYNLVPGTTRFFAYEPLPGWEASGGDYNTYAAWGDVNRQWKGAAEPTGADSSAVYFGNADKKNIPGYPTTNQFEGSTPLFNADGFGLADPANPLRDAVGVYDKGYGLYETPVTLSQIVDNLIPGQTYRLQFWATGEKNFVGRDSYAEPGMAALDVQGYERTFFKIDSSTTSSPMGKRYTVDFVAKDSSTQISFLSWGHYETTENNTQATELILDDVILTWLPQNQMGMDGVAALQKTCGINDVIVNEASPWAVFTVNGAEGQKLKLDLLDGTGVEGVDTNALQYLDRTDNTWKPYTPGLELTLPNDNDGTTEKAQILVRVGIVNDAPFENADQLKLQATFDNGMVETGQLTILDDGTGDVFLDGNKTATPSSATDTGYPSALNDDRGSGPQVNSIVVNEASPYAVFTLQGVAGAGVNLALGAGGTSSTAELTGNDADIGQALEFWNASTNSWVAYNPTAPNATFGPNGQLLVRVAVANDEPLEVSEDFTLKATYNNKGVTTGITVGASSTGQGVIKDDGTGTVFASAPANPLTGAPAVTGVGGLGDLQIDTTAPKDTDALNINNLVLNEGSPYAVFTVGSPIAGAQVRLTLGDGKATASGGVNADYSNALEVWNPSTSQWDAYTPGQLLTVPSPDVPLLVRTALGNQAALEDTEPFKLTATMPTGDTKTGTATILDDGRGDMFSGAITPASGPQPAAPVKLPLADTPVANPVTQTVADDDRPLAVNNVTVNEASPYIVFNVTGQQGQYVKLGLETTGTGNGHAILGTDHGTALEYWNGSAWTAYTPGTYVKVPTDGSATPGEAAKLLVRVPIQNDTPLETSETFKLIATNTGGTTAEGIGTIKDNGTGTIFAAAADNPDTPENEAVSGVGADGLPLVDNSTVKDDDRPLTVDNVTVNEASPAIVFTVTGTEGQLFRLNTVNGTASVGQDTGTQLQYLGESCRVTPTTLRVLANDVAAAGKTLNVSSVRLFSDATGGTGTQALTVNDQGTWNVNADGTVTFNPVAGLAEDTPITPVYYTVKDSSGGESGRSRIVLGDGATSAASGQATVSGTVGRYVRIEQSGSYIMMAEMQVMSGGVNVAQGKTTSSSGAGWGGAASRAVDGKTNTDWAANSVFHSSGRANPWWQVDLGSAVPIDQINVWGRKDYNGELDGATITILDAALNEVHSFQVSTSTLTDTESFDLAPASADDGASPLTVCGIDWVDYTPGAMIAMPDNGNGTPDETAKVLVRLAVKQDLPYEVSESFKLQAFNAGGKAATGIGTILDDGTGQIFANPADDPNTPANELTNPDGTPVLDHTTPKDDDRPLTVTGSTVREPGTGQSGYLPFTVSGIEGQPVKLTLASDSGTVGTDTGTQLQYWSGSQWVNYDPLNPPILPQVGAGLDGETGTLQVRVAVNPDALTEGTEALKLVATNRNGTNFSAPGYILEGAGAVVTDAPPIAVTGQTVNEASPYLVYKVSGLVGRGLSLSLSPTGNGNGHVDTDADISCQMPVTTVNVLTNDVVNKTIGDSINPASVLLFSTGAGGVGVKELLVPGEGTYKANANGTVSFTPVDGIDAGTTLKPIYYSVKTNGGAESAPGKIDLNPGALAAAAGTPQTAPWWQVDLGADVPIDSIKVFNRTDGYGNRLNGASVLILDAAGQVVQTLALPTPGTVETLTAPAGTTGRYVKIQLPSMEYLHMAEVEVYSNGSNLALGKPATQSSTGNWDPRGPAERAVDGNTDGHYFTGKSTTHTDWTLPPVTANDGTPGGTGASLNCQELEYFDGTNWAQYVPGSTVNIPGATNGQPGEMLVRARVVNDGVFEGPETLDLVATSTNGDVASGTGTILDDGTGLINTNAVTHGAPVLDTSTPRNDDRGATPSVNSFMVNEASPFGVFTVTGVTGAGLTLGLSDGTAEPEDHGNALEFFDMASATWLPYNSTTPNAVVQPDGRLLVRVALANDAPYEGPETFKLTATYNDTGVSNGITVGGSSTGTGTIMDDGTGLLFLSRNDDPLTPVNEANLGVSDGNVPRVDDLSPKDDDRGVSVADVTVNEGSPYIVFSLDSFVGQRLQVSVASATATLGDVAQAGVDASGSLEYWSGSAWVAYTPGSSIDVTAAAGDIPGAAKSVLVRMAVKQDAPYEVSESFTLTANTATGKQATATGTILDNGAGVIFASATPVNNAQGRPVAGVDNSTAKDDDRPYNPAYINNLRINEGSPWAVFTISGLPTAQIALSLPLGTAAGDATQGTDYADGTGAGQLQVYIQTAPNTWEWVDYKPNAAYPSAYGTPTSNATGNAVLDSNGQLLVRVKLENQVPYEGEEPFGVSLQYTGNWSQAANLSQTTQPQTGQVFTGYADIVDDGTGLLFGNSNTTGAPDPVRSGTGGDSSLPTVLDDDRPLLVGDAEVNEGSPYIVMPVTGKAGQLVKLELASVTATLGTVGANGSTADASDTLEYWSGSSWLAYTAGSYVQIPTLPGQVAGDAQTLLVRMAVANDMPYERSEALTLKATNTGGTSATGTGTILDNGEGTVFATGVPGHPSGVSVDPQTDLLVPVDLPTAPRNDDRPVTVDSVRVNEDSPFAVFTVTAAQGEPLLLSLASGTAQVGTDTHGDIEYWDASTQSWQPYVGQPIPVPANGTGAVVPMLVRVAIKADQGDEGEETFSLKAQYADGNQASATGAGTIVDDGTGDIFASRADDPGSAANEAVSGVNSDGTPTQVTAASGAAVNPATSAAPLTDDDRPVTVNDLTVNEGSPFAVFTVGAREGQYVQLDLAAGTATAGADYTQALEHWDGRAWTAYTPGTFVKVPGDGDSNGNEAAHLLVRVAVKPDTVLDGGETFTLTASNTGGTSATGAATIVDDGTGVVFDPSVNTATPNAAATPITVPLASSNVVDPANLADKTLADDDRAVSVNNVEVNEASPYLVWTVDAKQGQYVKLALAAGTATLDTDTGSDLEYWNGNAWDAYIPDTFLKVPGRNMQLDGQLLVRLAVNNDFVYEDRETLTLTATNTGGTSATGTGTIRDDGEGSLFGPDNTTAVPDTRAALGLQVLDDDRVAPPMPQKAEVATTTAESPMPATAPSLYVQMAVAEGRQAVSIAATDSTAGVVTARAISGVNEGNNVLRRTDALIDKFDRVTDPNLYVLPEVKSTRGQAFDAAVPAFTLQSGLLAEEIAPVGSRAFNVQLSAAFTPPELTLADQTLAELMQAPVPVQMADAEEPSDAQRLAQKQALHLAAARAALAAEPADAQPAQALARGQFGFSQQLQMSAAKRGAQSNAQSHTPWARPLA